MNSNKILLIAYTFPPLPFGGTYRSIRLCRNLIKMGCEINVLTINIDDSFPNDQELLKKIPESVRVYRTRTLDPWRKYQSLRKRIENWPFVGIIHKLACAMLVPLTIPDHMVFWNPFAIAKGFRIIKEKKIDTIIVSSPPNSTLLIGVLLKKFTNALLIVDLRDPIVDNVAEPNMIHPKNLLERMLQLIRLRYEAFVLKNSDQIVANTTTHRIQMNERYAISNIQTIRNAFDWSDFENIKKDKFDVFTISHLGSIYGGRNPAKLFKAIARLRDKCGEEQLRLQVLFYGLNHNRIQKKITKYGLQEIVHVKPIVPHKKALEIMLRSHLLILIKATGKNSFGQIPGKFFEYVGSGNPILYLGPRVSEVAYLIEGLNLGHVGGDTSESIYDIINKEYESFVAGSIVDIDRSVSANFSAEQMAQNMAKAIQACQSR